VAEKKTKVQMPNGTVIEGTQVDVTESSEKWTEVKLSDGTTIRTKPVILSVIRIDGQYDPEGNPMYQLKANQVMIADSPDHLKKDASGSPKTH
jgi:hypothetical protein